MEWLWLRHWMWVWFLWQLDGWTSVLEAFNGVSSFIVSLSFSFVEEARLVWRLRIALSASPHPPHLSQFLSLHS
jgi:hypothetical protein